MIQSDANLRGDQMRRSLAATFLIFSCLSLSGCGQANEINIVGAYFPLWLVALIIGVAAAFASRFLFVRLRIEPYVGPLVLIYVCITVSVSCSVWLLLA